MDSFQKLAEMYQSFLQEFFNSNVGLRYLQCVSKKPDSYE